MAKKSKEIKAVLNFLYKAENEDLLYAIENYSDELCKCDHVCSDAINHIVDGIDTLKSHLQMLVDEAIESGEISEEEVPEIIEQW